MSLPRNRTLPRALLLALCAFVTTGLPAAAPTPKQYDPGASDTEIKIGSIMPYSGPASAYGTIGKVHAAYFRMLNERGGINGRKIAFLSLDDAYSPPKTVEAARRLVERDRVLLLFQPFGTAGNQAIIKYLNAKKVPHLFVGSGAHFWNDPARYPWTIGWTPPYPLEGALYARHLLAHHPNARIGVLYQNDDMGKDYLNGFREALGPHVRQIVAALSYETSAPTIDSQIIQLKNAGGHVFANFSTPRFAAQAVRKVHDLGWKPVHYLASVSRSIGSVLQPAGLDKSIGLVSAAYLKDATDPALAQDSAILEWSAFMAKYYPEGDRTDAYNVYAYAAAEVMAHVLRLAGDNLTRANVLRQAESLRDLQLSIALPGITLGTSPTDHAPFESLQLMRFDGRHWVNFGDIMRR
jgi:branched-chain amino acid transport system substrate-binding protein